MKKSLKQTIFPAPPGVSEEDNNAMIRAFLTILGVMLAFLIIGALIAFIKETI